MLLRVVRLFAIGAWLRFCSLWGLGSRCAVRSSISNRGGVERVRFKHTKSYQIPTGSASLFLLAISWHLFLHLFLTARAKARATRFRVSLGFFSKPIILLALERSGGYWSATYGFIYSYLSGLHTGG